MITVASLDVLSDKMLDIFEQHAENAKEEHRLIDAQESLLLIQQIRFLKEEMKDLEVQLSCAEDELQYGER